MHDFVRGCGASTEGCVSLPRPPGSNFSCVKLRQHHVDFDCRSGVARRCALFTHIFHSSIRLMRDRFALTQRGPSEVLGTRLQSQSGSSKMSRDNRRLNNHRTFVQLQGAISHVPVVEWRRGRYGHRDTSIPSHPRMNWRCEPSLQSIRCMDHSTRCHRVYSRIRGEPKIRGYG
jgi:hypothetical protein